MLLKCTTDGKRIKVNGTPVHQEKNVSRGPGMKMTMSTASTMSARVQRKVMRAPHKRAHHPGKLVLPPRHPAKLAQYARLVPDTDAAPDSELSTDQLAAVRRNIRAGCSISSTGKRLESPGKMFDGSFKSCGKLSGGGKLGSKLASGGGKYGGKLTSSGKLAQALARRRALAALTHSGPPALAAHLPSTSRDGRVQLQIVCQPETQHRARYQTEGSRGAVKDNSGNGFPIVKLVGYDKLAVLQVFIGTDTGRVAPHMFYQACRVSGKNSTPCKERKEDGTVLIEIDLEPGKNWQVTCDCVGILKERNVDVEHRWGEALGAGPAARGKKKSTRCRMVFRTQVLSPDGASETLQVCSSQIICTQPPGVPEVCRKSLVSSPATGGLELFLLGKNFLKETHVVFSQQQDGRVLWEEHVAPDKEFLQQTHLVCCVPSYARPDISEAVMVQLHVRSGGKTSEPHTFYYTPPALDTGPQHSSRHAAGSGCEEARPVLVWGGAAMMPPPALPVRRPSLILPDVHSPGNLKSEADDSSQHSLVDLSENSNMSYVNENSCEASLHGPPDKTEDESLLRARLATAAAQMMLPEELKVIDLRLKSGSAIANERQSMMSFGYAPDVKMSPPNSDVGHGPSPLVSFTQQLQAIQNQVQTDKMVESVTAAIFNTEDNTNPIYSDQPILSPMPTIKEVHRLMATKSVATALDTEMKSMNPELMMENTPGPGLQNSMETQPEQQLLTFNHFRLDKMTTPSEMASRLSDPNYNRFRVVKGMPQCSYAEQNARMEALVEDAMQASGVLHPADAAKLDALVNSTVDDHMSNSTSPSGASYASDILLSPSNNSVGQRVPSADMLSPMATSVLSPDVMLNTQVNSSILCDTQRIGMTASQQQQEELMLIADQVHVPTSVKTPPAAVKSMILNAAAEILTSDSAMNALVTSAINTANILTTENASGANGMCSQVPTSQPPTETTSEAPMAAMSQAVSQAVTKAVSQAVSHAVSQAVSQEMTAPVQGLTDMSDSDLLSYINPSCFDQV